MISEEPIDFSEHIAQIEVLFFCLNLSWDSSRVVTWMQQAGFASRYDMPASAYEILILRLREQLADMPEADRRSNAIRNEFARLDRRVGQGVAPEEFAQEISKLVAQHRPNPEAMAEIRRQIWQRQEAA